ncbi:MAG: stage V sporulation protein AD [Oscillospiraceae bacterium]|nr:stage V sporulation protein AD [Oscillospiraceae bacterium]
MAKRIGGRTRALERPPAVRAWAALGGKKEGEGPLRRGFDRLSEDSYFGEGSWEKAETRMLRDCFALACAKAGLSPQALDCVLTGDLLNQCVSSAFAVKDSGVPHWGLYGACSTMAESLALGALLLDGGAAARVCALTGSHFCTAERQYRFPLEYGGQRTPTSQWTVTGAGAVILDAAGSGLRLTQVTPGRIVDAGVADATHMGGAMAPAAFDTLSAHFADTGRSPADYDAIFTGDLGALGHDILEDLFRRQGTELGVRYMDCGVLIYDAAAQDVGAGGSGCGCSAAVLCAQILPGMEKGIWDRVLFAATGALMSPTSAQQGESIPGVCHAIVLERGD